MSSSDTPYAHLRIPRKLTCTFWRKFSDHLFEKRMFFPRLSMPVNINLVMKSEVKREVRIPMISVVANPCTGPLPNTKRTIPVMIVVTLESMMADMAFLYPSFTARLNPLPPRSSSLTRS